MSDLKNIIAAKLREAREEANLTQAELADLLGMARTSYSHLEIGKNWVTVRRLVRIKKILGRSADYFLGGGVGELTDDELKLLELYRSTTDKELKALAIDFLRFLIERSRAEKNKKE